MTTQHQKYRAALNVAEILLPMLNPAPNQITITCRPQTPEKVKIEAFVLRDVEAVTRWHAVVGGELTSEPHGEQSVRWLVRAELAGIPLELWTLVDAPTAVPLPVRERHTNAAQAALGEWIDAHGDPGDWSEDVRLAYAAQIAELRADGRTEGAQ
ncbi:hypothetical protein [Kitasatospora sp. NPDC001175]|uniref:hypothetical protein n=1 Tax=Kitasatospora sp. NPDC001175 TaxID=3157103 RepID=UPI003D056B53